MAQAPSKGKLFIIYYSAYGHIYNLMQEVVKGIKEEGSFDVECYTASDAYVDAKSAPHNLGAKRIFAKDADRKAFIEKYKNEKGVCLEGHILTDDLGKADAFMFGIPTRFGMAPGKMKAIMDSTGSMWMSGEGLYGKPASIFFASGQLGGGQETTALTFVTQLVHHGMVYIPIGYGKVFNKYVGNNTEVHGGSPYGAGMIAKMDTIVPTHLEKGLANAHGKYFAGKAAKFLA